MQWNAIESAFNRAFYLSFSRKRLLLTFPMLVLCGIVVIFCRALSIEATPWIALSLGFLPLFLSSGILLGLGVVLSRFHYHEIKHIAVNIRRLISSSMDLIIGISYLSFPSLLLYLLFWIVLGLFFLLKEIPGAGEFFSVILSFGPFLLIFACLVLSLLNLALLFFVAPAATVQTLRKGKLAKRVFDSLQNRFLSAIMLFLIGLIPLLFTAGFLSLAAFLTNTRFFLSERSMAMVMEWLFIMLPFAAVMTPSVVFFFSFSAEAHLLLQDTKCVSQ